MKDLFDELTDEQMKDSDDKMNGTSKDASTSLVYIGTPGIRKLITYESPMQILTEDFPKHQWPISGGWGYSQDDAVVIETKTESIGVSLEYKFLEYRTYEEAIIFRPEGQQLAGIQFKCGDQSTILGQDGKCYDRISMEVTAYTEDDYNYLKADWVSHNAYEGDDIGKQKHLQLADSKKIVYEITGWFDISNFYKKG